MKAFAFVCALLLVGAQADSVKVVETPTFYRGILEILVDLTQTIGGYLTAADPLTLDYYQLDTEIAGLINLGFSIENLAFAGFSDLQVTRAEFENDVLSLDVFFVNMWVSTDLFRAYAGSFRGEVMGSIGLENLGFALDIQFDTSDGVSFVDFELEFKRPTISANLRAEALGNDYTDFLMDLFNNRIPVWFDENGAALGDTIRAIIWRIINSIQDNRD